MRNNVIRRLSYLTLLLFGGMLALIVHFVNTNSALARAQTVGTNGPISWQHLSTKNGDLAVPSPSDQQVLTLVLDIDKDGKNDFVIGSRRSPGPSMVWYKRTANGWNRHVIDSNVLQLEAGGAYHDIDGDGDIDVVAGSSAQDNEIWWWENPHPDHSPNTNWQRRIIKNSGANKHHDMLFGDFDGDNQTEFVYWNQDVKGLFLVNIPANPRTTQPWPGAALIFTAPDAKREGLAAADIDGDGKLDLVGGGYWFKHNSGNNFTANLIEHGSYMRVAVGQLVPGGRPEIVQVPGDANGQGRWFQWNGSKWIGNDLPLGTIKQGHSLELGDANGDGHLDIFIGEMRFPDGHKKSNPQARTALLLGDGQGGFTAEIVATGYGHHESRLADLDGDGDLDILGKPYLWDSPRLDVWLNGGGGGGGSEPGCGSGGGGSIGSWEWQRRVIDSSRPGRATFLFDFDVNGDGRTDIVTGKFWYRQPSTPTGSWARTQLPAPLEDVIAAHDFDGDGDVDLLGTAGKTLPTTQSYWAPLVWARNDNGQFTTLSNIDNTGMNAMPSNDPVQGVAVARFTPGGPLEVAITWDNTELPNRNPFGIQMLTVPSNPSTQTWARRTLSDVSVGEDLNAVDMDGDNDLDLFAGQMWLRNDRTQNKWAAVNIFTPEDGQASRHRVVDVDNDGDLDAVIGYAHGGSDGRLVTWYEQQGAGKPWNLHVIDNLPKGDAESMDVVDIDNDGDYDIVVGEYRHKGDEELAATLFIFENRNNGADWTRHLVHDGDSHYQSSRAIDIDNDGDYDILAKGWHHDDVYLYEQLGCGGPGPAPTATPKPGPTATPSPESGNELYHLSSTSGGKVGGVSFADDDILLFDSSIARWSLYFDGSDVGLATHNVDAFHLRPNGEIILSLTAAGSVPGVGAVDDSDLLLFTPTSIGENTAGAFSLLFDGSDVELTTNAENINAVSELPDGRLVISTNGNVSVAGVSATKWDLLLFTPNALGPDTRGTWSLYAAGAGLGLDTKSEAIFGASLVGANDWYIVTKGAFKLGNLSGKRGDVFRCMLAGSGQGASCSSAEVAWRGNQHGFELEVVDALHVTSIK